MCGLSLPDSGTKKICTQRLFQASDYMSSAKAIRLLTVAPPDLRRCPCTLFPGSCERPVRALRTRKQCWRKFRLPSEFAVRGACHCRSREALGTAAKEGQCGFRKA